MKESKSGKTFNYKIMIVFNNLLVDKIEKIKL